MNEEQAREILGDAIQEDGSLYDPGRYIAWDHGENTVTLDDWSFTAEELMAIAWWMANK